MQETKNYNLPQWEGNDLTDWYQLNQPMATIDTQMKANAEAAETAQNQADSNTNSIGQLTQTMNRTIDRVTKNEQDIKANDQQITLNVAHLNEHDTYIQNLETAVDAIEAEIGSSSGDPGTGTIQGDISALKAQVATNTQNITTAQGNISDNTDHIGDLAGLETGAKNNLVEAINELFNKGGNSPAVLVNVTKNLLALLAMRGIVSIDSINDDNGFMLGEQYQNVGEMKNKGFISGNPISIQQPQSYLIPFSTGHTIDFTLTNIQGNEIIIPYVNVMRSGASQDNIEWHIDSVNVFREGNNPPHVYVKLSSVSGA